MTKSAFLRPIGVICVPMNVTLPQLQLFPQLQRGKPKKGTLKGSYFNNPGCNAMKPGVRNQTFTIPATEAHSIKERQSAGRTAAFNMRKTKWSPHRHVGNYLQHYWILIFDIFNFCTNFPVRE
jgi:hypothetical protein